MSTPLLPQVHSQFARSPSLQWFVRLALLVLLCTVLAPHTASSTRAQVQEADVMPGPAISPEADDSTPDNFSQNILFPPVAQPGIWYVVQGYNTTNTHNRYGVANELYAFDLVLATGPDANGNYSGDANATEDVPVVSGVEGKVVWKSTGDNMVMIRLDDRYLHPKSKSYLFAKYGHMEIPSSIVPDVTEVKIGDPLGLVSRDSGRTGRHIHFNLFSDDNLRGGKYERVPEWCRTCPAAVIHPHFGTISSWDANSAITYQYEGWVIKSTGNLQAPSANLAINSPRPWDNQSIWAFEGDLITFEGSASSDPDGSVVRWDWDFGDGNVQESGPSRTNHSYSSAGTYHVRLTVQDDSGLRSPVATQPIVIRSRDQAQNHVDIVLLIDTSGSMSSSDPADLRVQAAKLFIQLARIGDQIAVIGFNDQIHLFSPMTEITSLQDRETLSAAVDQVFANGGTNIGGGLEAAYAQLAQASGATSRKAAILLTDGKQDCGGNCDYAEQHLQFTQQGWRVYTIGLGNQQDKELLQKIADETKSKYYNSPKDTNLVEIYAHLAGTLAGQTNLFQRLLDMLPGSTQHIDQFVPSVPAFDFSAFWDTGTSSANAAAVSSLQVNLIDPDGVLVDPNDPSLQHLAGPGFEYYRINEPKVGNWIFQVDATTASVPVALQLAGNATDVIPPVGSIQQANEYVTTPNVTLLLEATDPYQPADVELDYSLSNNGIDWSAWQPLVPNVEWTLDDPETISYIYARFRDAAGNVSRIDVANYMVDQQPPETIILDAPDQVREFEPLLLSWIAQDDISMGDREYAYSYYLEGVDNDWSAFEAGIREVTYSLLAQGTYTLWVRAQDYAGNSDPTPAGFTFTVIEGAKFQYLPFLQQEMLFTPIAVGNATVSGPTTGNVDVQYTFAANYGPENAAAPIYYQWTPEPLSGQGTALARYSWSSEGDYEVQLTVSNTIGQANTSHAIHVTAPAIALNSVTISGPSEGESHTIHTFYAQISPSNATTPIEYEWEPAPHIGGQGNTQASYLWGATDTYNIQVTVRNPAGEVIALHPIDIQKIPTVAFTSNREGNWDIYRMHADGSQVQRLTNDPAMERHPSWLVDGMMLVFSSDRDGHNQIYRMDADGSNQVPVLQSGYVDETPIWSHDFNIRIAFARNFDDGFGNGAEVFVMNFDGTEVKQLTSTSGTTNGYNHSCWPSGWAKSSAKILYYCYIDGYTSMWIMDVDGSNQQRLFEDNSWNSIPTLSSNEQLIAFSSYRNNNYDIYTLTPFSNDLTSLADSAGDDWRPVWSPDGTQILFESTRTGQTQIYVMNADGSGETPITNGDYFNGEARWRP